MPRRTLLKAAGVSLALPWLEAFAPRTARGAESLPPRRLVCICAPLGIHAPLLFPAAAGKDYKSTPYLDALAGLRDDFTIISGLSHPDVESGHDSIFSFLTAAPFPERRAGFRNTISLDQFAAEHIGQQTRFPSLAMSHEGFSLSWTRTGALVPSDTSPARVFARLFVAGRPEEVKAEIRRLRDGQSILDKVAGQAKSLEASLPARDREKMDEYFSSVRELEKRLHNSEEWAAKPKPKIEAAAPRDSANSADFVGRTRLMFDVTQLALANDSTRLVTIMLGGTSLVPPIEGVNDGHHNLSHHGQDPAKLAQLQKVELAGMQALRDLLAKLKETKQEGGTLLDHTSVYFGSNLGNASSHACTDLPVIVAGGGFQHGQHLQFNPKRSPPLSNLYVSLLQRLGIEADTFGSSTGTLTGLEA